MSITKPATVAEVVALEAENAKLKKELGKLGPVGHDALRTLRAITLRHEIKFLKELLISIGKPLP
jgi:hypothetical protein